MDDETRLIRAGTAPHPLARTVGPPVQKGSTVLLPNAAALYDESLCTYGRAGLAAQEALQSALGEMEGARGVALYPSGQAAIAGALLSVLSAGDEVLVTDAIYKPVRQFCDRTLGRFGVTVRYVKPDAAPEAVLAQAGDRTRLIMLESPGSLTFEMQDIRRIAQLARARGILTAIDNTWGAGLIFKPLHAGVDLSLQSLTKYVGGHSDVFMGSAAVRDPALLRKLEDGVHQVGWAVAGEDAYQMLRGLRTLPTRLKAQGEAGLQIAAWLQDQPEVERVLHPALAGAPGHDLWASHFTGAAGLFAFALKPGSEAAVAAFLDALTLFGLGFSWGGFESLAIVCDPQLKVRRYRRDYGGPLIRLQIGLERPEDLKEDLRQALNAYAAHQV